MKTGGEEPPLVSYEVYAAVSAFPNQTQFVNAELPQAPVNLTIPPYLPPLFSFPINLQPIATTGELAEKAAPPVASRIFAVDPLPTNEQSLRIIFFNDLYEWLTITAIKIKFYIVFNNNRSSLGKTFRSTSSEKVFDRG
ncbi:MAG: hypothetical protein J6Q84_01540 [Kiritimatiellae bacterium]|nr:hypothetical protein [Kiritimatiellia bacterium]